MIYRKPNGGANRFVVTPADSDEFNDNQLGLQWQWQANPQSNWALASGAYGWLRLFAVPAPREARNFWDVPNLLLQKFPGPSFTATTKLALTANSENDKAGLVVMGLDYAYISIRKQANSFVVSQTTCKDADKQTAEKESPSITINSNTVFLRVAIAREAACAFSYSADGKVFTPIGEPFKARQGRWIGAKLGIFSTAAASQPEMGYADFDWFRIE
jgi:beta-xylosidase